MDSEKGTSYPVLSNLPDLRIRVGDDPPARWRETVLRLAQHQTFARSSFVRVDAIRTERGELMAFDAEGRLRATDGTSVRIAASFYNETYDADLNRCVRCEVDGTFLRAASDSTYEIAHRYDTVEFWLHATVRDATALAQIRLSAIDNSPSPVPVQTKLGIAVVIQRARRQLLLRALTAWLGAALVALPAILVESTPVGLRILSASVGALLIALVSVFMRSAV